MGMFSLLWAFGNSSCLAGGDFLWPACTTDDSSGSVCVRRADDEPAGWLRCLRCCERWNSRTPNAFRSGSSSRRLEHAIER